MTEREELQREYLEGVRARVRTLESLKKDIASKFPEAFEEVRRISHKISGSAGVFGFPELSSLAGAVEKSSDEELPGKLEQMLKSLKAASEAPAVQSSPERDMLKAKFDAFLLTALQAGKPFSVCFVRYEILSPSMSTQENLDGLANYFREALPAFLTKSDVVGRLDASSFLALLPYADLARAGTLIDKLIDDVMKTRFESAGGAFLEVKISAGLCEVKKDMTFSQAIDQSFSQSERAARLGGNCVMGSHIAEGSQKSVNILVADDDEMITSFVQRRLDQRKYKILTAPGGVQAMDIASREEIGLFVLDIQMPGMNGLEILERIRKMPKHAKTPVLMLTALGNETDIERAFAAGANDYLVKPFSPVELQARIRRLIGS